MDTDLRQEGFIDEGEVFDLDLPDADILVLLKEPIQSSEQFWNIQKLDETRKQNKDYYLGNQLEDVQLYDHNVPYIDNRVFISVETIVPTVVKRIPQPEVRQAQDTLSSQQLAKDLQGVLYSYVKKQRVMKQFKMAVKHLVLYRIGILKLRWDEDASESGEIITEYVLPKNVVFDKNAKPGENPKFMVEYLENTLEEIVLKFPDKKDEIFKTLGISRGVKTQLAKRYGYKEVWLTYYDKDGAKKEGVVWVLNELVLGKMDNPNWIYRKNKAIKANHLDYPLKPYIPINNFNLGEHAIDDTSAVEQSKILQDVLNKRGRQIVENADHTNGGWVFASNALGAEDAEKLTGAWDEKIIIDGDDVRTGVTRLMAPPLPNYVIDDKHDLRAEIDNIFGTHNVTRGEGSGNKTLGQDVLQQQQDFGRHDELVASIEDAAYRYYNYLVQMMKVYYSEDHWFKVVGEDGKVDHVLMRSDLIEDGIEIEIQEGSTLPVNRAEEKQTALELAKLNRISTLDLYEKLGFQNPQKMFDRFIKEMLDPGALMQDIQDDEFERTAFMDITIMNGGKEADPRKDVAPEHLAYHLSFMKTGKFRELEPDTKQLHVTHVALETEELRQTLLAEETQLPTEQDMAMANEKAVMEAGQEQQIMGPQPSGSPTGQDIPGTRVDNEPPV